MASSSWPTLVTSKLIVMMRERSTRRLNLLHEEQNGGHSIIGFPIATFLVLPVCFALTSSLTFFEP